MLVTRCLVLPHLLTRMSHFALGVLAFAEGDAEGEGLGAGLGLTAGVLPTATLGDVDVAGEGLAVVVEVELSAGSQPAEKAIEAIARSRSAARLMVFRFGILIVFSLISTKLKSGMMIAELLNCSNGCSHSTCAGISARAALKPSFSKSACTISEREGSPSFWSSSFRLRASESSNRLDSELPSLSQERIGIDVGAFPVTLGIGNDGN